MSRQNASIQLGGTSESLLLSLYFRAIETRQAKPLIIDQCAEVLVHRIDYDFESLHWSPFDQKLAVLRTREFDRTVQAFLSNDPDSLIVDIGCGLDTRFQRVDNGRMQWFGLDLPEVIDLRRQFIVETERSKLIRCSALDLSWMNQLAAPENRPVLFLAEGVFPYFTQEDVKRIVAALKRTFSPTHLAFDATSRVLVRLHNALLGLRRASFRLRWGIADPRDLESWEAGIRLLKTWHYFDDPAVLTPRIAVCRHLPFIRRGAWIAYWTDQAPLNRLPILE
jgi:O-methyltransferase involved in polyketide biosynthesis